MLPPPDPRSLCPQLNLLNPHPPNKIPGYATGTSRIWNTRANHSTDVFSPHSVHGRIRNENLPKRLSSITVCLSSEFLYVRTLSQESGTEHFLDGAVCFPEPNDFQFQLSKYFSVARQLCSDPLFKVIRLVLPSRSMVSCLPPATYIPKVRYVHVSVPSTSAFDLHAFLACSCTSPASATNAYPSLCKQQLENRWVISRE